MMGKRSFPADMGTALFASLLLLAVFASCALQPASTTGSIGLSIPTAVLSRATRAVSGPTGSGWILRYVLVSDAQYTQLRTYDINGYYPEARPIIPAYYDSSYVTGEISIGSQFDGTSDTANTANTQTVVIDAIPPKKQVHLIVQLTNSTDTYYVFYYSSGNTVINETNAWVYDTPGLFDIDEGVLTNVTATNPSGFFGYTNPYTC
ncbi:MAG: hypothetical protein ACLQMF_00050 [Rectinemataceae bacterium]